MHRNNCQMGPSRETQMSAGTTQKAHVESVEIVRASDSLQGNLSEKIDGEPA